MKVIKNVIIWSLFPVVIVAGGDRFQSVYTSIDSKDCMTISSTKFGNSSFSCEGYKNIKVEVLEEDLRQSITLIRDKKRYPLEMWSSVSNAFSFLGSKIEWRFSKRNTSKPIALITRYNISIGDYLEQTSSLLAVVKITDTQMCVVGKIKPQRNQNILAREMADRSKNLDCIGLE